MSKLLAQNLPTQAQTSPNWIDYQEAETALFAAVRPQLRLIARDYGRHRGAGVDDMAGDFFGAASRILVEQGTRRAFSDSHLHKLCHKWGAWWADHQCQRQQRAEAIRRNDADRRAFNWGRYGGACGAAKGRDLAAVTNCTRHNADQPAAEAQRLRAKGYTLKKIAEILGVCVRTIQRYLDRTIGATLAAAKARAEKWTHRKARSCTGLKDLINISLVPDQEFAICPPEPTPAEIEAWKRDFYARSGPQRAASATDPLTPHSEGAASSVEQPT